MASSLSNSIRTALAVAVCRAFLFTNLACTVNITPPVNPTHPTVVYLCDYGVHSSLLIPVSQNHYVEYLYGDWNWAALCHTTWLDAMGAIFWSQQATLGRRFIAQSQTDKMPVPPDGPKTEIAIIVNVEGCQKVLSEMDGRWDADRAAHAEAEAVLTDFWYVKNSQHYWWLHDCNLNTADSLREMGCKIDGYAVWSKFSVLSGGGTPPQSKDLAGP